MVLHALDQKGGVRYLMQQADENPKAFLALVARCIPQMAAVKIESDGPVLVIRDFSGGQQSGGEKVIEAKDVRIEAEAGRGAEGGSDA